MVDIFGLQQLERWDILAKGLLQSQDVARLVNIA
jgi:hypothetical protein